MPGGGASASSVRSSGVPWGFTMELVAGTVRIVRDLLLSEMLVRMWPLVGSLSDTIVDAGAC